VRKELRESETAKAIGSSTCQAKGIKAEGIKESEIC
jgi:hypothetical protein